VAIDWFPGRPGYTAQKYYVQPIGADFVTFPTRPGEQRAFGDDPLRFVHSRRLIPSARCDEVASHGHVVLVSGGGWWAR
jgi:hypothetical protein